MNARTSFDPATPRGRAGWSHHGAVWLVVVVGVLLATGWLLRESDPGAIAEWTDAERSVHRAASVLHGSFAWAFCILLGRWIWPHVGLMWAALPRRRVWLLGLAAAVLGAVVALTGLGLLYGSADAREPLSNLHWASGLVWPLLCVVHGWRRLAQALRGQAASARALAESGSPNTRSNTHAKTKV